MCQILEVGIDDHDLDEIEIVVLGKVIDVDACSSTCGVLDRLVVGVAVLQVVLNGLVEIDVDALRAGDLQIASDRVGERLAQRVARRHSARVDVEHDRQVVLRIATHHASILVCLLLLLINL